MSMGWSSPNYLVMLRKWLRTWGVKWACLLSGCRVRKVGLQCLSGTWTYQGWFMCSRLRKRSWGTGKSSEWRKQRQGMSLGSREIIWTDLLSNKSKRDLLHHLLVHLHPETKVSIIVRYPSISELDLHSLRVVWHKEVTGLLYLLSVVELTQVSVAMAPQVVSSVDKRVTSWKSTLRTDKVIGIRAIGPNLHQLLH